MFSIIAHQSSDVNNCEFLGAAAGWSRKESYRERPNEPATIESRGFELFFGVE
jgi:hypothetical protein